MAPSAGQILHYIYGKGSAASLVLILVNAAIVSALLLLACVFCNKTRTKNFNLLKSQEKKSSSELRRVTKQTDDGTRDINGIQNGVIATGTGGESEEKEDGSKMSPRMKNGMVHRSVKSEPDTTAPNLLHRVLPPPPENLQAAPPALEVQDPLYDTVGDIKEGETRRDSAQSNTRSIPKTAPPNQGSSKERTNPLYVSADEMTGPPLFHEATSPPPSHEGDEKEDDGKTQVVCEPLYAVVRKNPSVMMTPPAENPAGGRSTALENLNCDDQTVDVPPSVEQKPRDPSSLVDSMLTNWRKRSMKPAQLERQDTTVNVGQEVPPLVPEKRFDIESEFKQFTIEDTEIA